MGVESFSILFIYVEVARRYVQNYGCNTPYVSKADVVKGNMQF